MAFYGESDPGMQNFLGPKKTLFSLMMSNTTLSKCKKSLAVASKASSILSLLVII